MVDNNNIHLKKGTLLFIRPNQVRQWQNISSDFDAYLLVFENEFIETFFQDSFFIYRFPFFHNTTTLCTLECNNEFLTSLTDLCSTITHELSNLREDSHHYLRSILYNILIQINRKYMAYYGLSVNSFQNNTGLQFKKILEVKIRNYHRVEDYANLLKISRAHLNNISKKNVWFTCFCNNKKKIVNRNKEGVIIYR
jgi:AraC family transcriptional activator of pobA